MIDSTLLLTQIKNGELDSVLADIYGSEEDILSTQRMRYCNAISKYMELYGAEEIEIYSAPGRTEICGNHTDHQNGRVLAASINPDVIAVVGKSDTSIVKLVSEGYAAIQCDLSTLDICNAEQQTTTALIKGVVKGFQNHGYHTGSFKAYVTSDVLSGSGLSSSAAFESLIGIIQSGRFNQMTVSAVEIAMIGQYAENVYFGKPCGMMDQIACSVGDFVYMDFSTPEHPEIHKIDFDILSKGYCLCIVDTKGSHANLTKDYAEIPDEMKQVAAHLGKELLNEVSPEDFISDLPKLYGAVDDRALLRAYHFLTENERVRQATSALLDDRFYDFLTIIKESGNSSFKYLQNIYSNRYYDQQSVSIALALSEHYLKDNGVCRVHGGGFAGTIQAFVKKDFVAGYKDFIEGIFGKDTCYILKIRKQGCLKVF